MVSNLLCGALPSKQNDNVAPPAASRSTLSVVDSSSGLAHQSCLEDLFQASKQDADVVYSLSKVGHQSCLEEHFHANKSPALLTYRAA